MDKFCLFILTKYNTYIIIIWFKYDLKKKISLQVLDSSKSVWNTWKYRQMLQQRLCMCLFSFKWIWYGLSLNVFLYFCGIYILIQNNNMLILQRCTEGKVLLCFLWNLLCEANHEGIMWKHEIKMFYMVTLQLIE